MGSLQTATWKTYSCSQLGYNHICSGGGVQLQVQTALLNLKGTNGHRLILAFCMMVAFLSTWITGILFNILNSIVFKANKQIPHFSGELLKSSMQFQTHWKLRAMSLPLGSGENCGNPISIPEPSQGMGRGHTALREFWQNQWETLLKRVGSPCSHPTLLSVLTF